MTEPTPPRPPSGGRKGRLKGPKLVQFPAPDERPATPDTPANLSNEATLLINGKELPCQTCDLVAIHELGRGAYGVVEKMRHKNSDVDMAVKRIRFTMNSTEQQRLMMDLDVSMRLSNFPYTIQFYGALFEEGDVWLCMELMTTSLDKFYKQVEKDKKKFPEPVLGRIAYSVVKALEYLHTELNVIHRDVKPSNILINHSGVIKLCDFGISGQLVDSYAKTMSAGCKPYMAPERISSPPGSRGYDIRSDVWSFGITMVELASLQYPYAQWKTPFDQLKAVVQSPSPSLKDEDYSPVIQDFTSQALQKDVKDRPKYDKLLLHEFLISGEKVKDSEVQAFVEPILDNLNK